jgi:hypothetical protein
MSKQRFIDEKKQYSPVDLQPDSVTDGVEDRRKHEDGPRVLREKETMTYMLALYCRRQHRNREKIGVSLPSSGSRTSKEVALCEECLQLHQYAMKRLTFCPFGEEKTTCVGCPVHCYADQQREQIRKVMRYAGPRMLWLHPVLAVHHILDGRKVQ